MKDCLIQRTAIESGACEAFKKIYSAVDIVDLSPHSEVGLCPQTLIKSTFGQRNKKKNL